MRERWGISMPFEKKKKYKSAEDYKQKSIYFDENEKYQAECLALLNLCGHKQAKFLGLLAHDLIQRTGMNIDRLDKNTFGDFMKILELQANIGINNQFMQMNNMMSAVMMQQPQMIDNTKQKSEKKTEEMAEDIETETDEFISAEDMDDMNAALAAFGV